ncbi:hypothetical protein [Gottfriedia solisilvae]
MSAIDFTLTKGKRRRDWLEIDRNVSFDEKIQSYLSYQEKNYLSCIH